jgi:hypothetical protein
MGIIQYGLAILVAVFIYTVITGLFMKVANFIGELFGFKKLINYILNKIK